jgi:hypothetical protein
MEWGMSGICNMKGEEKAFFAERNWRSGRGGVLRLGEEGICAWEAENGDTAATCDV